MCITPNSEEAKCFEALAVLVGDARKAFELMKDLNVDGSSSLPFYGNAIYASIGKRTDDVTLAYKSVSDAFDSERIDYSIISYTSHLFPYNRSDEPVYYLYAAGNKELLSKEKVTCLGSPMPSLQGKNDMAKAVEAIIAMDAAVVAPLDNGLGSFALSLALKEGGSAIAVLSTPLSKCNNHNLLDLMGQLYEKGLLVSQFAPSVKTQKWHVVLRNRFLSGISNSVYLAEDKDGGPSWAVFDLAMELGAKTMLSKAIVENPNLKWPRDRMQKGSLVEKNPSDIRKLIDKRSSRVKSSMLDDLIPDLFS